MALVTAAPAAMVIGAVARLDPWPTSLQPVPAALPFCCQTGSFPVAGRCLTAATWVTPRSHQAQISDAGTAERGEPEERRQFDPSTDGSGTRNPGVGDDALDLAT